MIISERHRRACSLLADDKDRHTISVFITIDARTHEIDCVEIKRCLVRVTCNLTYNEADDIIRGSNNQQGDDRLMTSIRTRIQTSIRTLSAVAQSWRRRRLGEAAAIARILLQTS
jgi:exoribonuclease R